MTATGQLISDVQAFLEYKREEGVATLEISPETAALLKALSQPERSVPAARAPAGPSLRPPPRAAAPATPAAAPAAVCVKGRTLEEIAGEIRMCSACPLCASRTRTVPGEGNPDRPDILFVGEGPGAEEDAQGRPFVGAPGQLLDKMITAMGYSREEVFITNVVKCRPPGNRVPLPEEMAVCLPYLKAQIALLRPAVIVALGKTAVQGLLQKDVAITRFRGTWCTVEGIALMPTYHPAYLLRSPGKKGETWADLKAVLAKLGKEPPSKK